ncbi:uncharacterized protein LOC129922860 isoform X3 [Biomphalaria glabrata]|uniref:Uncharacterized protein LOC129922860 isoform X3 n=1 Tax=Biomphalaria glabrata TaxID=6526 RepID=A0A9W2YV98_BIOGL|nr:uncharacterized protein LOC129922860 isoform X3 [Biomphalaria glabrata]
MDPGSNPARPHTPSSCRRFGLGSKLSSTLKEHLKHGKHLTNMFRNLGFVIIATLLGVTAAVTTCKQNFALQNGTCKPCPPGTFSTPLSRSSSCQQMDTGNTDKQKDISVSQSLEQDIQQNHGVKLCASGQFRDNETCTQCPPRTYQWMSLHRNNACLSYSEVPEGCVVSKEGTAFRNVEWECPPSNSTIASLKDTALLNNGKISTNETTDLSTKTVTSTRVKLCASGQFRDNETCTQCPTGTYQWMSLHRNNACLSYSEVPEGCMITKEGTAFRNVEWECPPSNSTIASLKDTALLNNGKISTNETTDLSTKTVTSTSNRTLVNGSNTMAVSLNDRVLLAISVTSGISGIVLFAFLISIIVFVRKRLYRLYRLYRKRSKKCNIQKVEEEGAQLNSADTSIV